MNPIRRTLALPLLATFALAQAQPAPHDDRVARLYDVGDLLGGNEPGPDLVLHGADPADRDPIAVVETAADHATEPTTLVRLLRAFVKPALAKGEQITGVGDRWIAAVGRAEQHAWIERFLQAARGAEAHAKTIRIACRCYRTTEITFQRELRPSLQVEARAADDRQPVVTTVLAPGEKTDAFLAALDARKDLTCLTAPSIEIWPLMSGHVAVVDQTSYVRDFDLDVTDTSVVVDPIVDVAQHGLTVESSVVWLENGKLGVSLGTAVADLERPIPTVERTLPGSTQRVTVQLPNLRSTRLDAAFEIAPGQIIVMAPLPLAGERFLFVVEVTEGTSTAK